MLEVRIFSGAHYGKRLVTRSTSKVSCPYIAQFGDGNFDRYGQEGYPWRRYNSRNCQALLKAKLEIVAPVALC
jgi:hypothetical protein